jgi:hypothetical protein
VLRRKGHEVTTLNVRRPLAPVDLGLHSLLSMAKRTVLKYMFGKRGIVKINTTKQMNFENTQGPSQKAFIDKHIDVTDCGYGPLTTDNDIYDAYVVGSDQVWRPMYNDHLMNNYLDFVENDKAIKIAYSASFGVDQWETDEATTQKAASLAKQFNAISIREQSGIHLCKEHLGVEAVQVLDPTFLLDSVDYRKIYGVRKETEPYIATYVLDSNKDIQKIVKDIAKATGLEVRQLGKLSAKGFAPIEDWLAGIDGAKYVITDSFHGSVFSIIFGKQFITLGNESRGMSRFESLLNQFNLKERFVFSADGALNVLNTPIDYVAVDRTLEDKRKKANIFLDKYLKN